MRIGSGSTGICQRFSMKGLEYEMNLGLHLGFDSKIENGQLIRGLWYCEVTKIQGSLGNVLPMGKRIDYF